MVSQYNCFGISLDFEALFTTDTNAAHRGCQVTAENKLHIRKKIVEVLVPEYINDMVKHRLCIRDFEITSNLQSALCRQAMLPKWIVKINQKRV